MKNKKQSSTDHSKCVKNDYAFLSLFIVLIFYFIMCFFAGVQDPGEKGKGGQCCGAADVRDREGERERNAPLMRI